MAKTWTMRAQAKGIEFTDPNGEVKSVDIDETFGVDATYPWTAFNYAYQRLASEMTKLGATSGQWDLSRAKLMTLLDGASITMVESATTRRVRLKEERPKIFVKSTKKNTATRLNEEQKVKSAFGNLF